ncbi:hypothetical protein AJ87_42535 [Rhizobium yanglingense]|nr:hypothetical protein AJ87_42535 [Rhizobium yanglingense]
MYFDVDEIRAAFKAREASVSLSADNELVDVTAAGRRLGVKKSAVDQLIAAEIIPSHVLKVTGRVVTRISTADLDAFAVAHITSAELARTAGVELAEMLQKIVAAGLLPVVQSRFSFDHFYKKCEVKEAGLFDFLR